MSFPRKDKEVKASVVIPANNNPAELVRAIRSLKTQLMVRDDVEVIVVDDGSDPPLKGFLSDELGVRLIRVIRNDKVLGRGAARNAGIQAACGEIVIFMDSDMTAHPEFVYRHLEAYELGEAGACVGHVVWVGTSSLCQYLETRGVKKLKNGETVPWRYLVSSNFSCKKATLERVGSFCEEIKGWGGEDTLLGYDLYREGVTLSYLKGAVTYHHSKVGLDELCEKNYTFGRHSLPVLVTGRPEISRELRANYLMMPSSDEKRTFKQRGLRLLVGGLIRFPGHRVVRGILSISGRRLSFLCYDYLVYSSILRGFRDFLRDEGGDRGEKSGALNGSKGRKRRRDSLGVTS